VLFCGWLAGLIWELAEPLWRNSELPETAPEHPKRVYWEM
jgi:hypothetical protein